jgi:hypothetical protein
MRFLPLFVLPACLATKSDDSGPEDSSVAEDRGNTCHDLAPESVRIDETLPFADFSIEQIVGALGRTGTCTWDHSPAAPFELNLTLVESEVGFHAGYDVPPEPCEWYVLPQVEVQLTSEDFAVSVQVTLSLFRRGELDSARILAGVDLFAASESEPFFTVDWAGSFDHPDGHLRVYAETPADGGGFMSWRGTCPLVDADPETDQPRCLARGARAQRAKRRAGHRATPRRPHAPAGRAETSSVRPSRPDENGRLLQACSGAA